MIYIVQEFYDGKWWHQSFYVQRFYAEEFIKSFKDLGTYRIKEFKIPEDVE